MSQSQPLKVDNTCICLVWECACQVWSPGLTQVQNQEIEYVQKSAFHIIWPQNSYEQAMQTQNPSLHARRLAICHDLYLKVKNPENAVDNVLPAQRVNTHNLRNMKRGTVKTRTKRATVSLVNKTPYKHE